MNVSPEKQKLFERLHAEESEVVRFGHDFTPPELARQKKEKKRCQAFCEDLLRKHFMLSIMPQH